MNKIYYFLTIGFLFIFASCEDNPAPAPPPAGEVLVAEVTDDSVGITSGLASKTRSISSNTLDFTNSDSARITFYYSGENNIYPTPIQIYYVSGQTDVVIYSGINLNPSPTEQYVDVTIPSPKVNASFRYKIATQSAPGFSYFKFLYLKIYKK